MSELNINARIRFQNLSDFVRERIDLISTTKNNNKWKKQNEQKKQNEEKSKTVSVTLFAILYYCIESFYEWRLN